MAKILLVDDDPFVLRLTGAILESAGHEVITAARGDEALAQMAAAADPEVVISDMNMPGMDGLELCATLRRQGYNQPFILLTGDEAEAVGRAYPQPAAVLGKGELLPELLPGLIQKLL